MLLIKLVLIFCKKSNVKIALTNLHQQLTQIPKKSPTTYASDLNMNSVKCLMVEIQQKNNQVKEKKKLLK